MAKSKPPGKKANESKEAIVKGGNAKQAALKVQHAKPGRAGDAANVLFFVGCILLSVLFGYMYDPPAPFTKKDLMRSLESTTSSVEIATSKRVALGFNANVDVVVDASALLEHAGISPPAAPVASENASTGNSTESPMMLLVSKAKASAFKLVKKLKQKSGIVPVEDLPENSQVLDSEESLANTFKRLSSLSQATERTVSSEALFAKLVQAASGPEVKSTKTLGGNAALMAATFGDLGWSKESLILGGQVGEQLRELLEKESASLASVEVVTREAQVAEIESSQIPVSVDEQHLIMEYKEGTRWGSWGPVSERANRFIVSRDLSNSALATLEKLMDKVSSEPVDLFVVSGLHLLDAHELEFVNKRMGTYQELVRKLSASTLVHVELAAVGRQQVLDVISRKGVVEADSIGLNEQELVALYVSLGGQFSEETIPSEEVLKRSIPSFAHVVLALKFILEKANESGSRTLSRIHFHSFGYHILAVSDGSPFTNAKAAVAAGSLKASLQACGKTVAEMHGNDIDLKMMGFGPVVSSDGKSQTLEFDEKEPVALLKDGGIEFHVVPVLVCRKPLRTVGLGDAISATSLAYQI